MRLEVDRLDLELNLCPCWVVVSTSRRFGWSDRFCRSSPPRPDRRGFHSWSAPWGGCPWGSADRAASPWWTAGGCCPSSCSAGSGRSTMSISICPPADRAERSCSMAPSRSTASRYAVSGRLGQLTDDASSTLRLTLVADDEDRRRSSTLTFGGVVWWRSEAPRLRGELVFTGADARSAIGWLGEALGRHIVPMPSWLAAPFRLRTGRAGRRPPPGPDFVVELDGSELTGRLSLVFASRPEIDLALQAARLALPAEWLPSTATAGSPRSAACRRACAAGSSCRSARSTTGARRSAGCGRRCSCPETAPANRGRPGDPPGPDRRQLHRRARGHGRRRPELRGKLTAVTENLRAALAWPRPLARRCRRRKAELSQPGEPGLDRAGCLAL